MTTPSNDARALHVLLETVTAENNSPQNAWGSALECEFGSLDFARRHAEVVALVVGTLTQVASLPDRTRERFERYAWGWWMGVMAPQHAWANNVEMTTVIGQEALDQLGSAADLIEARMHGSLASPTSTDLDELKEACREWIDAVMAEDDLPDPLKMNLLQDLRHLVWLIENKDLFGVARVAAAGQTVVGNLIATGPVLPEAKHGVWLERLKKIVRAIVFLGAFSQGVDVSLALGQGAETFFAELTAGSSEGLPLAPPELPTGDGPATQA